MNLYLISQDVNNDYDTYDSAVVAAKTAKEAQQIQPNDNYGWCESRFVQVKFIGKAKIGTKSGVILASFNAG